MKTLLHPAGALALAFVIQAFAAPARAQGEPTTLAELQATFERQLAAARAEAKPGEGLRPLLADQAKTLEAFVAKAKGADRYNGRLMLVDLYLRMGERERAKAALAPLPEADTPALALIAGAELAATLGMKAERDAWVDAALEKEAPFRERMAVGMHLMTRMGEVAKGQKVFADALAAAKDDEERARIKWFEAMAIHEREDRDEEAHVDALRKLAAALPDTKFGGIARDRLRAADLKEGLDPIPLELTTTDGKKVTLADFKGKVLLVSFWASWADPQREVDALLKELHGAHAARGLAILGINLDAKRADFEAYVKEMALPWPQVHDGEGWETHAALRYQVEATPDIMLLDREGKIAGLHLFPVDPENRAEFVRLVKRAVGVGD
jgi:hypothetical protein